MTARGWVFFTLMCFIWGIPYLLIKVAVDGVSVPVLVFARILIGAVVLLPLALVGGGLGTVARHWKPVLLFSITEIIGPWWLLTDAERRVDSSLPSLVIAVVPVITVIASKVMGDIDRLSPARVAGLLLGMAGVTLLVWPDVRGGDALAVLELLGVAIGYTASPLLAARKLQNVPGIPMTAVALSFAAIVYAPGAVLSWPAAMPSGRVLAATIALGVICTAIAFVIFFLYSRPAAAADAVHNVFNGVETGANRIATFCTQVLQ
jgi:drug/metabolite transporter (DMT)-like permease